MNCTIFAEFNIEECDKCGASVRICFIIIDIVIVQFSLINIENYKLHTHTQAYILNILLRNIYFKCFVISVNIIIKIFLLKCIIKNDKSKT